MKPTARLRFVERSFPMHPFYKMIDAQGNTVQATQTFRILQQWWEEKQWAHDDWITVGGEWRDVLLEKE